MKILAIIPARGGSKGVPRKNIKLLGDKPLIAYSIEAAINCKYITDVFVSTEDSEIANVVEKFGVRIPFLRPKELAQDTTPTLPVLQYTINELEKQGKVYDAICLLQPTSPFRTSVDLDKAIAKFIEKETDSLVSVLEVPHEYNPHWVFESNQEGNLAISTGEKDIIARRQELPKAYHRDGSIYLTKIDVLKKGSLYGSSIAYVKSNIKRYVNIDTMKDWEIAEEKYKILCVE